MPLSGIRIQFSIESPYALVFFLSGWPSRYIFGTGQGLYKCTAMNNAENSKQIFPEKELRGHNPNFHIQVSVSDLYIPMIDLPILLQEICLPILGIDKSLTDT
jgi:hypothetical protein